MSLAFNPEQRQAIEHVRGPMLVVAGAGTGKTAVLVERIARLIANGHARPGEILAITYTENAAAEMRQRVVRRLRELSPGSAADLNAQTFHAWCNSLLQRHGRSFGVLDQQDLWIWLRQRLEDLPLERYTRAVNPAQFLDALLELFSRCHDELVDAEAYEQYVERVCAGSEPLPRVLRAKDNDLLKPEEVVARCREIARVYRRVEQMLRERKLGTFGHMLLDAARLLQSDPQALAAERARARFVLIDEFQDTNLAQIELAELLAAPEHNIFAVGDPDQAIYRFRGASSAAFAEFTRRFSGAAGVTLRANQRSLTPVLACAHAVISANPAVHCVAGEGKKFEREALVSSREAREAKAGAAPVEIVLCDSEEQEAAEIANAIESLAAAGEPAPSATPQPGQLSLLDPPARPQQAPRFGVLYRQHHHREALIEELTARGIPFSVRGLDALDTPEGRDLMACLRVLDGPDAESLFRVSAFPCFGLEPEKVRQELAAAGRDPLYTAVLERVPGGERVSATLDHARQDLRAAAMNVKAAMKIARRWFGIPRTAAVEALEEFARKWCDKPLAGPCDLRAFLAYMEYFPQAGGAIEVPMEAGESPGVVRLMTAHAAKGLEFDHVFVLRLNPSSFPASYRESLFEFPAGLRRSIAAEGDSREIQRQEERRLFYVAMTRARDSLSLLGRPSKNKPERPSGMFLQELVQNRAAAAYWTRRAAAPYRARVVAQEEAAGVGAWFQLAPSARMDDPALSATAVEMYETCPLQFQLSRDWNLPGRAAAAMQYGNAVHTVLRDFYQALQAGRPRSREQLLETFRQVLDDMHWDDPLQRALYEKQGMRQLGVFYDLRQQEPPPEVVDTERNFEIRLGEVLVRGRIDRLDRIAGDRVAIVDYKSGSPQEQRDADLSLQLSIYALAARQKWNLEPERLVLYNLEDNTQVSTSRSEKELSEAIRRVQQVAASIKQGIFSPNPNFHCRFCAYRLLCPATEQKLPQPPAAPASA